jgi:gamma-glutamyltranspeptidase / glutathione hydrolase
VLRRNEGAAATFLPDGEAPAAGDWFANPDLATDVPHRRVDGVGPETFYGGALGERLVDGLDALGGYRDAGPISRDHDGPLGRAARASTITGLTLHELPPAGQGIAALQMLKMLEGLRLRAMGHNSVANTSTRSIEAKKLADADLARFVADPDHMAVRAEALLDPAYLAGRARLDRPDPAADRAAIPAARPARRRRCI